MTTFYHSLQIGKYIIYSSQMKPSTADILGYQLDRNEFLTATPAADYEKFTWQVGCNKGWRFLGWIDSYKAELPVDFRAALTPILGLFEHESGDHPKIWTHIPVVTRNGEISKLLAK